jgi:c-di-GMP-binding flagellar brake protein YcgR
MDQYQDSDRRRFSRVPLEKQVEFYIDEDILTARTADLSATGMRITAEEPIKIFLRTLIDGKLIEREARIVWARMDQAGGIEYGFEYISPIDGNI